MAEYVLTCDQPLTYIIDQYVCDGVAASVDVSTLGGIPELTYAEANILIGSILGLWALAFVVRLVIKQFGVN